MAPPNMTLGDYQAERDDTAGKLEKLDALTTAQRMTYESPYSNGTGSSAFAMDVGQLTGALQQAKNAINLAEASASASASEGMAPVETIPLAPVTLNQQGKGAKNLKVPVGTLLAQILVDADILLSETTIQITSGLPGEGWTEIDPSKVVVEAAGLQVLISKKVEGGA